MGSQPKVAKAQLEKMRFVDAEIELLASQMAMLEAACASYTEALTSAIRSAQARNDE